MRVTVLKPLPQGQEPGEVLDLHEDVVQALMLFGAVEPVEDETPVLTPVLESRALATDVIDEVPHTAGKRSYRRRDLKAES